MKDLKDLRKEITEIDNKMAELFVSRMKLVHEIAEYKMKNGLTVLDPGREAEVLLEEIKELDGVEYLLGHTRDYVKVAVPLTENGEKAVSNTVVRGTVERFVNDEILLLSPLEFSK